MQLLDKEKYSVFCVLLHYDCDLLIHLQYNGAEYFAYNIDPGIYLLFCISKSQIYSYLYRIEPLSQIIKQCASTFICKVNLQNLNIEQVSDLELLEYLSNNDYYGAYSIPDIYKDTLFFEC